MNSFLIGVGSAMLRKKSRRAFEIVPITFQSGLFETVGDFLAFDDSERRIGPGFSAGGQLFDPLANFVEHGAFVESFPCGDKTNSGD